MKSILYTLGLVFVLGVTAGGSACAQTPFKQAPLQLPGGEFPMPMPGPRLPERSFAPWSTQDQKLSIVSALVTRKDSVRVLLPDRMSCRVPDLQYVERMPVRKLQNSHPVDAMPTKSYKP